VNTEQIAILVRNTILANSAITFRGNSEVESACLQRVGYEIELSKEGLVSKLKFDGIINCLWEDRIPIDRSIGIVPPRPSMVRYKAAICGSVKNISFPSATLITGAYGDIVNHNDGSFYLSWYPVCKQGESLGENYSEIEQRVASMDKREIIRSSVAEISKYIPQADDLLSAEKVQVGGGYIVAWGESDIHDHGSQLHQRHMIGPEIHDRWVSVDTGKYCTAPMFGVQAAHMLADQFQ